MTAFKTLKPSSLDRAAFVEAFADIYEHSPWVAEKPTTSANWLNWTRSKRCISA